MKWIKAGLFVAALSANTAYGAALANPFDAAYRIVDLGEASPGNASPFGGVIMKMGDASTILRGVRADSASGRIDALGVFRDAGGHIAGFTGVSTLFSTAPFIDGGMAYADNGTLLFTMYPNNQIGQIEPGSTVPDTVVASPTGSSVGTMAIVPSGYSGAGNLVLGSYNAGTFCSTSLIPDGSDTYNIPACGATTFSAADRKASRMFRSIRRCSRIRPC